MPSVSISKAAKLACISRQHLYDAYIDTGKISVDRSIPDKPQIDTSELIRVFGYLKDDTQAVDRSVDTLQRKGVNLEVEMLRVENQGLKALLLVKDEQIRREQDRSDKAEARAVIAETHYRALLEDKFSKPESFWAWLKCRLKLKY